MNIMSIFISMIAVMFPLFQILIVVLMSICLLFKADMEVGFRPIPVFEVQNQPLDAIPDEERDIEQFLLLGRMNEFMIQFPGVQRSNREDKAK